MKRYGLRLLLVFLTAAVGGTVVAVFRSLTTANPEAMVYLTSVALGDPEFRFVNSHRDDSTHYETFLYQSLDGEIKYAEDCIGCKEQIGDTDVLHSFVSAKESDDIYGRYLENPAWKDYQIVSQSTVFDETGKTAGKRALTVLRKDGKVVMAFLFWTENGDLWRISSFDENHVTAFERSQWFHRIKRVSKAE
ncbi:MAG: hypothetical protein ABI878_01445 [Acidobacteriota bacterium]